MTSFVHGAGVARPVLFVDASLQGVQIALVDPLGPAAGRVLWQGAHGDNKGALVHEGLQAVGITASDLVGLAVGVGPGSFTGIKVALAFVYGLRSGVASSLPVLGVSSLEAAARALAAVTGAEVLVALPATRTHGFVAGSGPSGHQAARLIDAEAPKPLGLSLAASRVYITGSWPLLGDAVAAAGATTPSALTIEQLAAAALPELVKDIVAAWPHGFLQELPAPRYLRLSTAEERLRSDQQAATPQPKDLS